MFHEARHYISPIPPCTYGRYLNIYDGEGELVDYLWVEYKNKKDGSFHFPKWIFWENEKRKIFAIKSPHCTNFPLEGTAFTKKKKAKEYCKKFKCCEYIKVEPEQTQ